jgi:hypothetical protein
LWNGLVMVSSAPKPRPRTLSSMPPIPVSIRIDA